MPARSSAAFTATPPRSTAEKFFSEPDSLPIGVRAPLTMTDPAMGSLLRKVGAEGLPGYRRDLPATTLPERARDPCGFPTGDDAHVHPHRPRRNRGARPRRGDRDV